MSIVERVSLLAASAAQSAVLSATEPLNPQPGRATASVQPLLSPRVPHQRSQPAAPRDLITPLRQVLARPLQADFWRRHWRLALGVGLVGGAAYAASQPFIAFTTENTMVSASLLRLRAPIGGELVAPSPGQPALTIRNPLADNHRVIDARSERDRLGAELAATSSRLTDLAALAADIGQRAALHRDAVAAHLTLQAREAGMTRNAAEARALRAARDAGRSGELARVGVAATSQLDRADAERVSARAQGDAAATRIQLLQQQAEAATRGVFTENGHIGTGYAEQRLDELSLRRMELHRMADVLRATLAAAERRVNEEEARLALLSTATLTVPEGLALWRTRALPGQRVVADETIAEVVDCRAPFLLAAIPQSQLSGLTQGTPVRLRLAGSGLEWRGRLTGFLPDSTSAESMAALPSRPREPSILAQVALDPPPAETPCPVGLTGRAVFQRASLW